MGVYKNCGIVKTWSIYETRNTFCRTRSLSNATFSCLITWLTSSTKSAAVYKISWKSDDFSLRYGDISIFKMAAVRHLGIVLPPYETPTKSLLLAAAACQISCQSDTQIWRYSYLIFSHIWLEMPIQAPKVGVFGDFGPLNVIIHHRDPPKGTFLRKSASFKLSTIKICWGVWPIGELTESVTYTHTDTPSHTDKFIFCPCIALDRQLVRHDNKSTLVKDVTVRQSAYAFLLPFHSNYGPILYRFPHIARYWLKIAKSILPSCIQQPRIGWSRWNVAKTRYWEN